MRSSTQIPYWPILQDGQRAEKKQWCRISTQECVYAGHSTVQNLKKKLRPKLLSNYSNAGLTYRVSNQIFDHSTDQHFKVHHKSYVNLWTRFFGILMDFIISWIWWTQGLIFDFMYIMDFGDFMNFEHFLASQVSWISRISRIPWI